MRKLTDGIKRKTRHITKIQRSLLISLAMLVIAVGGFVILQGSVLNNESRKTYSKVNETELPTPEKTEKSQIDAMVNSGNGGGYSI